MSAATLKPIRLEYYLRRLSGANKVSLFRADSLARYLLQFAKYSSVVAMDKTVVGLTLRLLMSYIYGAPILDVSRSHTTTQHSR